MKLQFSDMTVFSLSSRIFFDIHDSLASFPTASGGKGVAEPLMGGFFFSFSPREPYLHV